MRSYDRFVCSRRIPRHSSLDLYRDFYKTHLYASVILLARDFEQHFLIESTVAFLALCILITLNL